MPATVIALTDPYLNGCASVERRADGLWPWRLPHQRHHLFRSSALIGAAACTADVRLRFETDATALTLRFVPLVDPGPKIPGHRFDAVLDGEILQVVQLPGKATEAAFTGLPAGRKVLEIWLPPSSPVGLQTLDLQDGSFARPIPDRRPLWVTWGSSLTHCYRAGSAARTWPGTVARRFDLNHVNLGFGGQCHLDPTVAMHIRDLPADLISLKLGINTISGSLNGRSYPALVAAAIAIIREGHPDTPMALISPIAYPPRETEPGANNYTISAMRADMQAVVADFVTAGDRALYYVDGLRLFDADLIAAHSVDQCHPEPAGIDIKAANVAEHVMPLLLGHT